MQTEAQEVQTWRTFCGKHTKPANYKRRCRESTIDAEDRETTPKPASSHSVQNASGAVALWLEQDLHVPSSFRASSDRKPESVKSPFESLIMYLELAMKRP